MANVHVAHDVPRRFSHTVMANYAALAGHVHLGDWTIVGGLSGVHQFCRVGEHVMIGFSSAMCRRTCRRS